MRSAEVPRVLSSLIARSHSNLHILGNLVNQSEPAAGPHDDYPYSDDDSDLSGSEGGLYDPETGLPLVGDSDDSELDDDEDDEMDHEDAAERSVARFLLPSPAHTLTALRSSRRRPRMCFALKFWRELTLLLIASRRKRTARPPRPLTLRWTLTTPPMPLTRSLASRRTSARSS